MNKRILYLSIYLSIYLSGSGQINLVPNPSFEDTLECFIGMGVSSSASANNYLKNWYTSSFSTSDYFNTCANSFFYPERSTLPYHCFGYQTPRTGDAYVGIAIFDKVVTTDTLHMYSEYVSVELKSVLKANTCYYGEFYINHAEYSGFCSNQISMLLTTNIFTTTIGSFTNSIQPQIQWDTTQYFADTLNWVKVSGTFFALGGEKHLTLGNFKDGVVTKKILSNSTFTNPCGAYPPMKASYIHIDDVALYELPTPQLGALNYTICNNSDSLVLGDTARLQTTYQWFANGLPISTSNTIIVKPTQTTNYVLQSTQCGITNQTITVTYSTNCEPVVVTEPIIPNVFTPNGDNVNDTFKFELYNSTLKSFTIYDRWGLEMYTTHLNQHHVIWDGHTTSGMESTAGVYFYVLEYTDVNGDTHKKNGYVTLIR